MSQKPNARQRISQEHAKRQAAEKRNSLLVRLGVIAVIIAVIAVVAIIIVGNSSRNIPSAGAAPAGATAAGGIKFTSDTEIVDQQIQDVDVESLPDPDSSDEVAEPQAPTGAEATDDPANVIVYADPACNHCAAFEASYGSLLEEKVASGDITLEYRTVGYLDRASGSNYSSRAANMLACVADEDATKYFDVAAALYAGQAEGERSDDELIEFAGSFDVDVASCVDENKYRPFVAFTTKQAQVDQIRGTPSVWVEGQDWFSSEEQDFAKFLESQLN